MTRCFLAAVTASLLSRAQAHDLEDCVEDNSELQTHGPLDASPPADAFPEDGSYVIPQCTLPANGAWAKVASPGQAPFQMAVYKTSDFVSTSLLTKHNWEDVDTSFFGAPGHAYDIGGNIGFYTFVLAKAGWNVTTFEPMPSNHALFKATLCANPDITARVDLHPIGLGSTTQHCELISGKTNVGDGIVNCGKTADKPAPAGYVVRKKFEVKRLDDVMDTLKFAKQHVDFVKVDVEGFECQVFKGAKKLLAQKPRLIQTEVWKRMRGSCKASQYLQLFRDAKYQIKADVHCKKNANPGPNGPVEDVANYWMCAGA